MEYCKYRDTENPVICAFCYAPDSRGCTSVSVVKRFIALGERHGWAMRSYLSELCSFTTGTTDCKTLVLDIRKVRAATLPPGSCCYVHVTGDGSTAGGGAQAVRKGIAPGLGNEARRRLDYGTAALR